MAKSNINKLAAHLTLTQDDLGKTLTDDTGARFLVVLVVSDDYYEKLYLAGLRDRNSPIGGLLPILPGHIYNRGHAVLPVSWDK